MAYGTIYEWHYRDINAIETIIRLKQEGYSGSSTVRNSVNSGCQFEWGDSSNDIPIVYGSQVTIGVDAEIDGELAFLFDADASKHLIEIYKGGDLFWQGFVEPDSYSEPLIPAPYGIEFTAYDMLGFLSDVDFVDDEEEAYSGEMSLLELLQLILLKTGLTLTLNTATDFEETAQVEGTDYFEQHKINMDVFEGFSCFEVLTQILHGHRLQQRNGEWWIVSYTLLPAGGEITFNQYLNGDIVSEGTVAITVEDSSSWWIEGEADKNTLPAFKKFLINQDYGYVDNLLKNGDFTQVKGGSLKYWTENNTTAYVRSLNSDGDVFVYLKGTQIASPPNDGLIHDGIRINQGNGSIKLSLKYGLIGDDGISLFMMMRIKLIGDDSKVYYIKSSDNSETEEVDYIWTTDRFAITIGKSYRSTTETGAFSLDEVEDNLKSWSPILNEVPVSGKLVIELLEAFDPNQVADGCVYADVSVELLADEEDSYAGSQALTVLNSNQNNNVPDDIDLNIGVVPDISNNTVIYRGGILRADGTSARLFRSATTSYYGWAELIGRIYGSIQRSPRIAYEGAFADIVPRMNLIITHAAGGNIRLLETGISYDDTMQTISGQYVQILTNDLAGFSVSYEEDSSSSSGGSSSGGGGGTTVSTTLQAPATIKDANGNNVLELGGAVKAYYDNEVKIETNAAGVKVTGTLEADEVKSDDYQAGTSGYRIGKDPDGKSRAEVDELSVRGSLFAQEFVINQTRAQNGNMIIANSARVEKIESIAAFTSTTMTIPDSYLVRPCTIIMSIKIAQLSDILSLLQLAHVTVKMEAQGLRIGQKQYIPNASIPLSQWFTMAISYYEDDTEAAAIIDDEYVTIDEDTATINGATPSLLGTDNSSNDSTFELNEFEIIDEVAKGRVYTIGGIVLTDGIGVLISHDKYLNI